ncbi:hypothetical protein C0Q70_13793 [Pomacea canaliculata]|uniref:WH1 domain-containing protein n=1 Tax=Pomacea canaliculata TaxID=400727 RepID=A0A2T7NY72_POMCA|nr:hypothetical protein C0Q70_13793 [Pomacea canaliculata]
MPPKFIHLVAANLKAFSPSQKYTTIKLQLAASGFQGIAYTESHNTSEAPRRPGCSRKLVCQVKRGAVAPTGDYLVEVQAQVMTRDDSTQCWVPMGGGGLSTVKLCKYSRLSPSNSDLRTEYVIQGERIADKSVVLNCVLKKDIQYTKANPKFHHWNTDEKRFGLTFERSDDAKAFDHGIRHAVADLSEGYTNEGEERVFQMVNLPMTRKNSSSQSASTTSTTTSSPSHHSPSSVVPPGTSDPFSFSLILIKPITITSTAYIISLLPSTSLLATMEVVAQLQDATLTKTLWGHWESWSGGDDVWVRSDEPTSLSGKSDMGLLDGDGNGYKDEPYVIFAKNKIGAPHEYSYPSLEPVQKPPAKRESTSTKKQPITSQPYPPLPIKTKDKKHKSEQCRRLTRTMFLRERRKASCLQLRMCVGAAAHLVCARFACLPPHPPPPPSRPQHSEDKWWPLPHGLHRAGLLARSLAY